MTTPESAPTPRQLCTFLGAYASAMLGSGATCTRIEKNSARIAARSGLRAELFIMPRHVHVCVRRPGSEHVAEELVPIAPGGVNFNINARLSRLSWDYADSGMTLPQASRLMHSLLHCPGVANRWLAPLVGLAGASFCRIFGGDAVAMAIVFFATALGVALKQLLLRRHWDTRVVFILCAFVSSLIGAADSLLGLGATPAVTVGTSILYLVPGIPFINSFSDMLAGHYICAFGRLMDAVVLTACLSLGLCAGMFVMHLGMF